MRAIKKPAKQKIRSKFAGKLADEARFIKAWFDNPSLTGAVSPSGRSLARYMAMQVDPASAGPVIELGPGTGPVTQALIERGIDEARLIMVEYDPDFCALLAARYPRATIVQGDAYALAKTLEGRVAAPAAAVVSSLPLLLRSEPERLALLADAFALMQPGAPLVQFTYGLKSPVPRSGAGGAAHFQSRRSRPIWLNLPPAHVWVYRQLAQDNAELLAKPDLIDQFSARTRRMGRQIRGATQKLRARLAAKVKKARM